MAHSTSRVDLNTAPLEAVYAELTRTGLHRRLLQLAHEEDLGPAPSRGAAGGGDITSRAAIPEGMVGRAALIVRQAGVLAGLRLLPEVLQLFAPRTMCQVRAADGQEVEADTVAGVLEGPMREILAAERTLLNGIGRLSGIATRTREFVRAVEGTPARIFDTRKTTPGLRVLEKYAVRCGGGMCHRIGLFDAVLIKDNHIATAAPEGALEAMARWLTDAAARARAMALEAGAAVQFVQCEVDSLAELEHILSAGGCGMDMILLDNMPAADMQRAVQLRDRSGLRIELEASGGIRLENVRAVAETGVDRISVGALTHSASSLDVSLDVTAVG